MKIAVYFLAIISCAIALPAEIPFEAFEELDPSKLTPKNVYVEPINPVKTVDLPGSRIIGGAELAPNSAPYQVAVITDDSSFCGGSLISTTRVLTTARCTVSASYVQLILGAHYYSQSEASQVRLTSTSIVVHEYFGLTSYGYDISVIFLPAAVSLSNSIRVIPLAAADAGTYAGSWGFLAGWGITTDSSPNVAVDALRGVYLNVITNAVCSSIYGSSVVEATHLCTSGSAAGIVGGCSGDNGGPLVIDGVQVGLVAFFPASCQSGNPTGFTRISSYRSWIAQNAGV